jgi:hypothetical protein
MRQTIRLAALMLAASLAPAAAMPEFKRGVSMELWTSWPAEAEWGDEAKLFPFPEWRRTVTQSDLEALKGDGLDFVRLPLDPGVFLSPVSAASSARLMGEVKATVADIRRAGLNVIVDLHTIPAGDSRPASIESVRDKPEVQEAFIALAGRMAGELDGLDGVALELINEPVMDCEPGENAYPAIISRLHAAARAAAPALPLVVTGACWGDPAKLAALPEAIIADANSIFTFHSYAPFLLTHQGASWAGDFIIHVSGLPFPPDRYGKAAFQTALRSVKARMEKDAAPERVAGVISYLDELAAEIDTPEKLAALMEKPFLEAAAFAAASGIAPSRILLGEFGMIRQEWGKAAIMPDEWRVDYMRAKRKLAEKHGFGWAMWGYSGAFGVAQEFSGVRLEDGIIRRVTAP